MTKQTIEVEGLPEGWKLTRIKLPDSSTAHINSSTISCHNFTGGLFDLEKIQPRRMVPDHEIWEALRKIRMYYDEDGELQLEVKETAITLNSEEPKLSLTKKDMLDLIEHIKLGGQLNPKIAEFIKENS